jgi:hypothetical protein
MEQPFKIRFDFLVANSNIKVSLSATAELHHSDPYYVVQDFYFEESGDGIDYPSVLPPQEIKMIKRGSRRIWVHRDSEQESLLSTKIGEAIEAMTKSDRPS